MRILSGLSGSLLVLALAVTGCANDDPGKESKAEPSAVKGEGATTDACKLLKPADLKAKFGSQFDDGVLTHQAETGGDQCTWTTTDGAAAKTFSVTVLNQAGLAGALKTTGMSVAELFDQAKLAYPKAKPVDLGDKAYSSVNELQVLDGDTWYSFSMYLGASHGPADVLKELATQVVG